jgi:hypothetical protein
MIYLQCYALCSNKLNVDISELKKNYNGKFAPTAFFGL